jgi:multidrug efflux pump subunit AcrA (membrane-fusion protein)
MLEDLDARLDELAEFAQTSSDPRAFFEAVLRTLFEHTPIVAAAIWSVDQGVYRLRHQAGLVEMGIGTDTHLQRLHEDSLAAVCHSADGYRVEKDVALDASFYFQANKDSLGNHLVLEAVASSVANTDDWMRGLLAALAEIARDFSNSQRTRELLSKSESLERGQSVLLHLYQGRTLEETAYHVANELANALELDRVTVTRFSNRRSKVVAISGVAKPESRAAQVRNLESLTQFACETKSRLEYPLAPDSNELDQQVMDDYVDAAQVEWVRVQPCLRPKRELVREGRDDVCFGAIVLEHISPGYRSLEGSLELMLIKHATNALAKAKELEDIPLRRLGAWLSRSRWYRTVTSWSTYAYVAAATLVLIGIGCIPVSLIIDATGVYEPKELHQIYAPHQGEIVEVYAHHQDSVQAGQPLFQIRALDLELKREELRTQRSVTLEKLRGIEAARLRDRKGSINDASAALELSATERELQETLKSQDEQLEIVRKTIAELQVRSPIEGQVISWNPLEPLERRPVQQGQKLMTVAALRGDGQLHLFVNEEDVRHITDQLDRNQTVKVDYALANEPTRSGQGIVQAIGTMSESVDLGPPRVRVVADISSQSHSTPRAGTTVQASLRCGTVSLAYAWTRRFWDYLFYYHW